MSIQETTRSRSPIKVRPLRDAGQSLHEKIEQIRDEELMPWAIVTLFVVIFAALEWLRWLLELPLSPIIWTLMAGGVAIYTIRKVRRNKSILNQLRLGLEGERSAGQRLQADLIPLGYRIIHDVCIDEFNVDHVAIGPAGVFVIEVKTVSKPTGRDSEISYDGKCILVDGWQMDRDPLRQVQACSKRLQQIINDYAGRSAKFREVVLFPGWWISKQPAGSDIWVLNDKSLVGFVKKEPTVLDATSIHVIAEGLARYVRDQLDRCK